MKDANTLILLDFLPESQREVLLLLYILFLYVINVKEPQY